MAQVLQNPDSNADSRPAEYSAVYGATERDRPDEFQLLKPILRPSYRVLLTKDEDDWIVAKCLDIKGAVSQGKTKEEAAKNIIEAITAILEYSGNPHEFSIAVIPMV